MTLALLLKQNVVMGGGGVGGVREGGGGKGVRGRGRTFKFLCFYDKAVESSLHTQS